MEFTTIRPLRSEPPVSGNPPGLYLSTPVPGAIYNRKTFPRKRHSVSESAAFKLASFGVPSSSILGASVVLKPPLSLRQHGS